MSIMPWTPKHAADDSLQRARAILAYSQEYELPPTLRDDLVRTSLIMGVSALDTYLHASTIAAVRAWKPSAPIARVEVRFDDVCTLVDEAVKGRSANAQSRPWVLVKASLHERLLTMSFQSSRSVESALSMCGVNNPWSKISTERGVSIGALKTRLDGIVRRRNQIVHESDLQRESRPQRVKHEPIDPSRVGRDLNWLDRLIEAIDAVLTV